MSEEKQETIWVKAKKTDRVALFERNELHPGGEVYVSGTRAFEVAVTRDVRDKLRTQELVEINESEATKLNEKADKVAEERREAGLKEQADLAAAQERAGDNPANAALEPRPEPAKEAEVKTAEGVGEKPLGGALITSQDFPGDDKPAAIANAPKAAKK